MEPEGTNIQRKAGSKARVKVAIRVRPMLPKEMTSEFRSCVNFKSESEILISSESFATDKAVPREYKFDRVFRQEAPQHQVYRHCIKDLVLSCFEGYNAAVLAYGQTGSGKTYTMGTAVSSLAEENSLGIIPRVITEIFDQVQQRRANSMITVTVSYIELYNEQIVDLLTQNQYKNKGEGIAIKEDRETGLVNVEGVVKECVSTPEQMLRLLERGGTHRTTKHTNMNDVSSRSHAIFTIYIDSQPIRTDKDDKKEEALSGITHSRFFFADLAGSERAKKTGATGDTLKEGININLGLLELGNVISALSTIEKNKDQFITFRNSKLTRILQDALGGNSNTYMIACVSPAQSNYQQSLNTLKYASKAMNIKNTPVINRNKNDMLKQQNLQLKAQNRRLKQMLAQKGVKVQLQDQKPDMLAMESKLLRDENRMLTRRYNQCLVELQQTKHKFNELEIKMYDIRREKDIMQLQFQEILKDNPQIAEAEIANSLRDRFEENQKEKVEVLEKYLQQIQHLETKLVDKDNLFAQLQAEYNSMLENSKKDEKLLIKKHNMLYAIGRQNNKLKQEIARLTQQGDKALQESAPIPIDQSIAEQVQTMIENLQEDDEVIQQHEQDYNKKQQQTKEELKQVDRYILQKEEFLEKISKQQLTLETEVINSMKNEYHQKIALLQKERKQLMKQRDQSGMVEKSKFVNKIDNLQQELKDYRKKAKEQLNMQKQVENQKHKIRDLGQEIKKFKMQKMELHRKLKQDRDNFDKLKNKRIKEIMQARKENIKKDNEIRKERMKNFKKDQTVKHKDEEIKRIKRVNEALKNIVKPTSRNLKKETLPSQNREASAQDLKNFDKAQQDTVFRICKQIAFEIDREQSINNLKAEIQRDEEQLTEMVNEITAYKIKKDKIDLKAEDDQLTQQEIEQQLSLSVLIRDLDDNIKSCEQRLYQRQRSDLLRESIEYFDIEANVLYSKNYETIDTLRSFIKALMQALKNYIFQNCRLLTDIKNNEREMQRLRQKLKEERENLMNLNAEYYRSLAQMRQDNMHRFYSQEPQPVSVGLKRLDEREKKEMEKKFQELAKNNRHLTSQLQKTRRKCEVIQEKYQSIKNLVSKDKNIGRQEQPSFIKPDKKMEKQTSNRQLLDQLQGMSENLQKMKKVKSFSSFEEQLEQNTLPNQGQLSSNRWECVWKVDAHSSGVLSMSLHSNFLISTATKSIRIWDLQNGKMIAELPAPSAVRYAMIDPQRRLFFTACQKTVTIWDLISLQVQGVLKYHRDQVQAIHGWGDYIFTGGKGSPSSGSLMVWDLRKLNPNQALQEKEKNQDIFTFASAQKILYYGTRNHSIRRMNIGSWDVLSPFQPPHLDSVTGLAIVKDRLVSGSKDKHLRLWALDHAVNNSKHTLHAFNDYVNTVQSPANHPIIYAGSKDGQVKACFTKNDRIEVLGGILAHTQSINAICTFQDNPFSLITGSQDKVIKIWQPTRETMDHFARQGYFE